MVFHQTFFGEGPEAFDPVEVDLPVGESFAMIDPLVPKTAGEQAVVALESVGVHQAAAFHILDGELEKGRSFHVLDNLNLDLRSSFQDFRTGTLPEAPRPLFLISGFRKMGSVETLCILFVIVRNGLDRSAAPSLG